jgi:hypothetical protein
MYVVNNSIRALLVALSPLAALHAILFAIALLRTQHAPALLDLPSPDRVLVIYVAQLAIDGVLLFSGHLLLRGRAISSRFAYAVMGGVMAAASYAAAFRNGLLLSPPEPGSAISAGLLPAFAGMMAGFLYGQFAGLSPAAAWPKFSAEALNASRRFDGPTRVRTSVAAVVIASMIPAAFTAVLAFTFAYMYVPASFVPDGAGPIFLAALPAQLFLITLTATIVPSAVLILSTHHIARAMHRSRGIEYAGLASLMSALCSICLAPFTPVTSFLVLLVPAIVCGAIMGALYRRFAGLEPMPLPEPVLVTDENTLVPADHSSRQGHGVMFTG